MPRSNTAQLNVRSDYVRKRVDQITARTGMTATEVVEEALRAYAPPFEGPLPEGLIRKGRLLVLTGGPPVTIEQTLAAIEAARNERGDVVADGAD